MLSPESFSLIIDRVLDIIVNFIGVLMGAYTAFRIAKWQLAKEAEKEEKSDQQERIVALKSIEWELLFNAAQVKRLQDTLTRSEKSRADLWRWSLVIIEFTTRVAYDDLLRSGLQKGLPQGVQDDIFTAYNKLHFLSFQVKQEAAAQEFYESYKTTKIFANKQLVEVQEYGTETHNFIWTAINVIRNWYPTDGHRSKYSGLSVSFDE